MFLRMINIDIKIKHAMVRKGQGKVKDHAGKHCPRADKVEFGFAGTLKMPFHRFHHSLNGLRKFRVVSLNLG